MKHKLLFIILLPLSLLAQRKATTQPMSFSIDPSALPSNIHYVPGSLHFEDSNNDNTIDANEQCQIMFKVFNTAEGDGNGCEARISATGTTEGIKYHKAILPKMHKGDTVEVVYPINTDYNTKNGKVRFTMDIYEPHGLGTETIQIDISTHQFEPPKVEVVSIVDRTEKGTLQRKEKFTLQVMIQNLAQGKAEQVKAQLKIPTGVTLLTDNIQTNIGTLQPNEARTIEYEMIATVNAPEYLHFDVLLSESFGKYSQNKSVQLKLGKKTSVSTEVASGRAEDVQIQVRSLLSDVDENIPVTNTENTETYALIIANENYLNVANVPRAIDDGRVFREYCQKTLGIPETNIQYVINATGNTLKSEITFFCNKLKLKNGTAKAIVYYAGHGMPDNNQGNGNAYLLPTDGLGNDFSTAYKLDNLYAELGKYKSRGVMVFLDACFSGGTRNGAETLDGGSRGIAVVVKRGQPVGNMVVFSVAQGNQTAHQNKEKQHGMFTYYLLKKLKETKGNVSLQELSEYVTREVQWESNAMKQPQQPTITPSKDADTNWKNWKLNEK